MSPQVIAAIIALSGGPRLRTAGRTVLLAGLARLRLSTWLDHRASR